MGGNDKQIIIQNKAIDISPAHRSEMANQESNIVNTKFV